MKEKQKIKKRRFCLLITFLFLTTYVTSQTFKKVNYQDISIYGTELFSIDDIVANASLNFPTPLILIKTNYIEKELKKNLSLEKVSVFRQVYPFGLKILIKTRTPIAYSERILNGEKIPGFVDKSLRFLKEDKIEWNSINKTLLNCKIDNFEAIVTRIDDNHLHKLMGS